jgi:hypothetical protein
VLCVAGADTGYESWSILGIFSLITLVLWAKLSSVSSAANFLRQVAMSGNLSRSRFQDRGPVGLGSRLHITIVDKNLQHRDSRGRMQQSEGNLLSDSKVVSALN